MTASALAAKGLDISLAALQRQDPYINNIVDVASQVALYTYNNKANEWEKTEVEGTLFIYTRLASPRHGFTIMNRLSMENLTEPITKDLDFQLQDPFLLYRNARLVIHGIWFYDKEDCQRIAQRIKFLTHQEQVQAQSQGGWLSPGGGGGRGGNEGKPVDIIQMLSKARTEYDKEKSSSEPKEIGGSSVLYGNPNLIKPIPVKPNTQENEGSLSLATLFGSQHKHHSSKPEPFPSSTFGPTSSTGKISRPPVARTLTYEDTSNYGQRENSKDGAQKVWEDGGTGGLQQQQQQQQQQQSQTQHCPAIQKLMQGQRGVLQTLSESPENRLCDNGVPLEHHHVYHQPQQQQHHHHHHHHHHQHQHQQPDPIKRLFQSQPPVSVSLSPRCPVDLPVPQSQLLSPQSVPQSQLLPAQSVPQSQLLPAQSQLLSAQSVPQSQLLSAQSVPQSQLLPAQSQLLSPQSVPQSQLLPVPQSQLLPAQSQLLSPQSVPQSQLLPAQSQLLPAQSQLLSPQSVPQSQLLPAQSVPVSHLQQNQPLIFNRPQAETQHNCQISSAGSGAGFPAQMPGVVSPHELLQKLQIIQQEQSLASCDPPHLGPALAPRFMAPPQSDVADSSLNQLSNHTPATVGQKAALQFQVISPQRIPATVAPTMLLSPSVFAQTKSGTGLSPSAKDTRPGLSNPVPLKDQVRILSRTQLQATLLHLIQNDSSFLDTIYEAYTHRFTDD